MKGEAFTSWLFMIFMVELIHPLAPSQSSDLHAPSGLACQGSGKARDPKSAPAGAQEPNSPRVAPFVFPGRPSRGEPARWNSVSGGCGTTG
jgi:hypothetical protein